MSQLDYANRTGRGPGRVVRALGLVLPGVREVQRQVEPYADAWHAHNRRMLDRTGRRWIVLGDSMSQGIGASAWDAGWLRGIDLSPEPVLINLSATGARVRDVLDQQLPAYADLGPRPDDLLTVMIGSNDLFAGGAAREALPDGFAELTRVLPEGAVVATLPQPRTAARLANRHLDRAAERGRLRLVDLRTSGPDSWRGRLAPDFFHPNDLGYAAMAAAFAPVLRAAWR